MARSRLSAGFEEQRRAMLTFTLTTNAEANLMTASTVNRIASLVRHRFPYQYLTTVLPNLVISLVSTITLVMRTSIRRLFVRYAPSLRVSQESKMSDEV